MKWVTREKAKVDRIACPWLIKKFVDTNPEFLFVPPESIPQVVKETGAIPYDAKGIELTHYKEEDKNTSASTLSSRNTNSKTLHFWNSRGSSEEPTRKYRTHHRSQRGSRPQPTVSGTSRRTTLTT